jgi:GntR family transcriptional regulator/MocR family aminotransferase
VVEEEYDAEARFDGQAPSPPLHVEDAERVVSVTSLNRILFRSLRLGFMLVPRALREPILHARAAIEGYVGLPHQLVLREFIEEGAYSAHLRRSRDMSRERRDALLKLVEPYLGRLFEPELNPCGLHLVLRPRSVDVPTLENALRNKGMACGTVLELTRGPCANDALLLGFAAFSPDVIESMRPALESALAPFA